MLLTRFLFVHFLWFIHFVRFFLEILTYPPTHPQLKELYAHFNKANELIDFSEIDSTPSIVVTHEAIKAKRKDGSHYALKDTDVTDINHCIF